MQAFIQSICDTCLSDEMIIKYYRPNYILHTATIDISITVGRQKSAIVRLGSRRVAHVIRRGSVSVIATALWRPSTALFVPHLRWRPSPRQGKGAVAVHGEIGLGGRMASWWLSPVSPGRTGCCRLKTVVIMK